MNVTALPATNGGDGFDVRLVSTGIAEPLPLPADPAVPVAYCATREAKLLAVTAIQVALAVLDATRGLKLPVPPLAVRTNAGDGAYDDESSIPTSSGRS